MRIENEKDSYTELIKDISIYKFEAKGTLYFIRRDEEIFSKHLNTLRLFTNQRIICERVKHITQRY